MVDDLKFSFPDISKTALNYIRESLSAGSLSGDGPFGNRCRDWLNRLVGGESFLVPSGTAALELACLLAKIVPGDQVIMPSFTFTSTANAVVLRGATPVFIDIRPDTLNMDERLIEQAITPQTRAIIPVHYAGIACDMDAILDIAERHRLMVIEDAAQALGAFHNDRPLGTIGALGCLSFHVTKNIVAGEGGALLVNDPGLSERAHILCEKGTNRRQFNRGEAQKYEWLDLGSSFLLSDVQAALLLSQFERTEQITTRRLALWQHYHAGLADAEARGWLHRPSPPPYARHNAHIYFIVLPGNAQADVVRQRMADAGIPCPFHFVPLHSSPAGQRFGRVSGPMSVTNHASGALLRLPLHSRLSDTDADRVLATLLDILKSQNL